MLIRNKDSLVKKRIYVKKERKTVYNGINKENALRKRGIHMSR